MKKIAILLYNVAIQSYHFSIWIASFFSPKAKKWIVGRKNWEQKLRQKINFSTAPIWIHCASLGEFEQGRPIIEKLKEQHKNIKIVLSFFSPSGYEVRKNYPMADVITYLPIDSSKI